MITTWARSLFAFLLLVGLYGIALGVVAFQVLIFLPLTWNFYRHGNFFLTLLSQLLSAGGALGLIVILYILFVPRRPLPGPRAGVVIPRDDAPKLWEAVDAAATQVGTAPPAELRLTGTANAAVTEESRLLGLLPGTRRLRLGLPLVLGMTGQELKAVLAHEMGHYAHGHTRFGAVVYRGSSSLKGICTSLRVVFVRDLGRIRRTSWLFCSVPIRIAFVIFRGYDLFYDLASLAVRRGQEFQADAVAAEGYGADTTASALRAAHALPVAWNRFVGSYLDPMRRTGTYHPDDPFSAFETMLNDPDYRDVLATIKQSPPEPQTSHLDSHPSLARRLERLRGRPTATGTADTAPAADLIPAELRRSLSRAMRPDPAANDEHRLVPWQEWLELTAARQAATPATELLSASRRLPGGENATLDTILRQVDTGHGSALAAALLNGSGDTRAPGLPTAIVALIGHHLTRTGSAHWTLSWTGPSRLVAAGIGTDELNELVSAAIANPDAGMSRLRMHLAELGIDPTVPVAFDDPLTARPDGPDLAPTRNIVPAAHLLDAADRGRLLDRIYRAAVMTIAAVAVLGMFIGLARTSSPNPALLQPLVPGIPPATYEPLLPSNPAIPVPSIPLSPPSVVRVLRGDTLSTIACRHHTTVAALQQFNDLGTTTLIRAGEFLLLPQPAPITTVGC